MGLKGKLLSLTVRRDSKRRHCREPAMSKGKVGSKKVLAFLARTKAKGADPGSGRDVPSACQHLGRFSTWASIQQLADAPCHSPR